MKDQTFKLLLVGDSMVGKSCILLKFADNTYSDTYIQTVVVDFWDVGGQDRFRSVINSYYRGTNGIIIVYDVTNRDSFNNVQMWFREIDINAITGVCRLLVGNKSDLVNKRLVDYNQGKQLADSLGIPFLEISAKTDQDVDKVFLTLVKQILQINDTLHEQVPQSVSQYMEKSDKQEGGKNDNQC
ncbi:MAG: putative GTP-binding protein ypt1 [Streblomastix strix]|uniref:Putative GTP-binding protein ypt1 n=1 Tax=Streblomastix strix TaxID=222440 RepID=A0A5J4X698_9EUKA|nr:MAG: putative GTP-binding protein ypt1 [Streblomastix strix]